MMCDTKHPCNYSASIMEIHSGLFITDGENGEFRLGNEEDRLLFFDETDAENTLLQLNEEDDGCYTLIDETMDMGPTMSL